jgi:hypothetical protein
MWRLLGGGQDWLVVVVETGAGAHPAQSAVQHAHFAMGEFEVQLLIGIAGWSKEDDAPIGSVVASGQLGSPIPSTPRILAAT